MYSCIGMPVNRGCLGGDQQFLSVGRELVTVEVLEVTFACGIYIENDFYFFSCFERVLDDLRAFGVHLCVVFTIGRGDHPLNVFRAEASGRDIFQIECLLSLCHSGQAEKAEEQS